jgi:hypothetical protein
MAFWELNPEVLRSLWLMASATLGRKFLRLKAFMIREGGHLRTEEKHLKSIRVAECLETTCYADLVVFWGTASNGLLSICLHVGDFRHHSVGTNAFQAAGVRAYFQQLILSQTSIQCSDVVGEKWNLQILVNLPVANVPRCVSRNAKTLGL